MPKLKMVVRIQSGLSSKLRKLQWRPFVCHWCGDFKSWRLLFRLCVDCQTDVDHNNMPVKKPRWSL